MFAREMARETHAFFAKNNSTSRAWICGSVVNTRPLSSAL